MSIFIKLDSKIFYDGADTAVCHAIEDLRRDIARCCCGEKGADIRLVSCGIAAECFTLCVRDGALVISAGDALGYVYGIYEVSRQVLGVLPFWFWNDQRTAVRESCGVAEDFYYESKPAAVRYRGWFINDEVLIADWSVARDKKIPWQMAFEALLRLRGNLVIPGTDHNARKYAALASERGLYVTHHHAEPLGAEMFSRVYPHLIPSYREYPDKYEALWQEGIARQSGQRTVWNLGFRGQGDRPFWEDDPAYDTPQRRGELMSALIEKQYALVKQADPEAVCCTNLYGETMELYRDGFLTFPADVIKIWADNGYGRMVTRRQGNHNPRADAMPRPDGSPQGIYYHASFYDLQAANHITMHPNEPGFVQRELSAVEAAGAMDYWIINCSNIKPHVYMLDLIAAMWRDGANGVDVSAHREQYIRQYYRADGQQERLIEACFQTYFECPAQFGAHEDEHAGEQFVNHVPRMLISEYRRSRGARAEDLLWMCDGKDLEAQVRWYLACVLPAWERYKSFRKQCGGTALALAGGAEELFADSLGLQAQVLEECYEGARLVCKSLLAALARDYKRAFYLGGRAREAYVRADSCLRDREHGKWKGFYANECLTDIGQSVWVLEGYMSDVRNLGDGPHFFEWQREFLYPEEDRRVMLILNYEKHLTDLEIYELMCAHEGFADSE